MATRLPGIFADISDKRVSSPASANRRVLAIGIKLPAGSLAVNTERQIFSEAEAIEAAGEGSQAVQMVRAIRSQNARVNLTLVVVDAPVGAAATQTLTVSGTATTAEPAILRIEGETVVVDLACPGHCSHAIATSRSETTPTPSQARSTRSWGSMTTTGCTKPRLWWPLRSR